MDKVTVWKSCLSTVVLVKFSFNLDFVDGVRKRAVFVHSSSNYALYNGSCYCTLYYLYPQLPARLVARVARLVSSPRLQNATTPDVLYNDQVGLKSLGTSRLPSFVYIR